MLFDTTIEANIRFGLDADVDHDAIVNACKQANIYEFVTSLPLVPSFRIRICDALNRASRQS